MAKELSEMTIPELVEHLELTRAWIDRSVLEARKGGSTWTALASSLGVSKQEVSRRYSWLDKLDAHATGRMLRPE